VESEVKKQSDSQVKFWRAGLLALAGIFTLGWLTQRVSKLRSAQGSVVRAQNQFGQRKQKV
jgi:uncharacterized protein with ACT and thioredoxin-like domain